MTSTRRLPTPNTDAYDWQRWAACRTVSNTLFFGMADERGATRREREERAKTICATCPVQLECRTHALTTAEPYGVWGGLTPAERQHVLKGAENR